MRERAVALSLLFFFMKRFIIGVIMLFATATWAQNDIEPIISVNDRDFAGYTWDENGQMIYYVEVIPPSRVKAIQTVIDNAVKARKKSVVTFWEQQEDGKYIKEVYWVDYFKRDKVYCLSGNSMEEETYTTISDVRKRLIELLVWDEW